MAADSDQQRALWELDRAEYGRIEVAGSLLTWKTQQHEAPAMLIPPAYQPSAAHRDTRVAQSTLFGTRCWAEHWEIAHV